MHAEPTRPLSIAAGVLTPATLASAPLPRLADPRSLGVREPYAAPGPRGRRQGDSAGPVARAAAARAPGAAIDGRAQAAPARRGRA